MRFGVFLRLSPSVGVALTNRHGCGSAPRSPHPAAGLVTPCRQSLRTRLSLAPAAFASLRFRMWWFPLFRTPSGDRRHCHSRGPSRMPTPHFIWVPSASAARPLRCCTSRRHPTRPSLSLARFRLCACTPAPGLPVLQLSTPAHVPPSVPRRNRTVLALVASGSLAACPVLLAGCRDRFATAGNRRLSTEHGKRSPLAIL